MKIKSLIKELQKLDPDLEVVLAADPEGNSFGVLEKDGIDADEELVFDLENNEFVEIEESSNAIRAVVLFPSN